MRRRPSLPRNESFAAKSTRPDATNRAPSLRIPASESNDLYGEDGPARVPEASSFRRSTTAPAWVAKAKSLADQSARRAAIDEHRSFASETGWPHQASPRSHRPKYA